MSAHHKEVGPAVPAKTPTKFVYDDGNTLFAESGVGSGAHPYNGSGYVGYMRDAAVAFLRDHHADGANPTPDPDVLARGGYTIVTTFDHRMMDDAVAAADQGLWKSAGLDPVKRPGTDALVHLAFTAVDPKTGYVRAFYTGVDGVEDYRRTTTNDALRTPVQVSSTFFPITLAAALKTGKFSLDSSEPADSSRVLYWPMGSTASNNRLIYSDRNGHTKNWPPNGDDSGTVGPASESLRQGLELASNSVFANLEMEPEVSPRAVLNVARSLGLGGSDLVAVPSLTLGAASQTPASMAGVYAAFADGGVYRDPVTVAEVRDAGGRVVWKADVSGTEVMPQVVAADVTDALKGVITSGTAAGNRDVAGLAATMPGIAGKTGTADFDGAAWFDGYNGQLAASVTMFRFDPNGSGPDHQWLSMEGTAGLVRVAGSIYPTSVWAKFMALAATR
jgi:membrane peptidoglycan carboxypeptidase